MKVREKKFGIAFLQPRPEKRPSKDRTEFCEELVRDDQHKLFSLPSGKQFGWRSNGPE
jgi:hypothetical protein